jgi:hypothetical protein
MGKKNELVSADETVKVTRIANGDISTVESVGGNKKPVTRKISNNKFVNQETGEIIERKKYSSIKADNKESLNKSIKNIREFYYYNVKDYKLILMYTLTYKDKILDDKKLGKDHEYLIKKLRQEYRDIFGEVEYIYLTELYGDLSGFHIHGVLYFPNSKKKPFISAEEFKQIWKKGDVSIKAAKNIHSPINYLTPHESDSEKVRAKKMNEKYERLCKMSSGVKLYRHSNGMKQPIIERLSKLEVKNLLVNHELKIERNFIKRIHYKQAAVHFIKYSHKYYAKKSETSLSSAINEATEKEQYLYSSL